LKGNGVQTFNPYQYEDHLTKSQDAYANAKYEIILNYLSGCTGLDVLNAGCGSGELSLLLAQAGHRVVGIDPGEEYIHLARANAERAGVANCSFALSSIEDLPEDQTFDCVLATDVLEHIEDDRTAFAKLVRLVKPEGFFIITVPAGRWLYGYHDEAIGHYRRYSRRTLRQLAGDLCHIEKIRYFGFSLIPICFLYSKVLRRPYPVAQTGDRRRRPLMSLALRTLLRVDRLLPMPFGTSLIMKGTPRTAA
jgi:2-polyprenyl-3-methyl-5-hydroxy-6-metoxy-1,4-benzoquinol methylase